jgi:hypothetical protein
MSIRLMAEVWRTDLPTVEKMVLLVIADHANDEGTQSYPSQATIASKASISVRTVQRAVNSLVSEGYIRLFKHSGGSAGCREDRRPHLYQINLGKLRGDNLSGRQEIPDETTMTTTTGRLSRPMNHPLDPSIKHPDFEEFWKIYPRKVAKAAALKAWIKAKQVTSPEEIIAGAQRYANDPNRHPSYTAHPATWLNAHRWGDEPLPQRELSKEEQLERDRKASEERRRIELEESQRFFAELEEQRKKAAPPPKNIREMLRNSLSTRE